MKLFNEIRVLLVRATEMVSNAHAFKASGPSKGKMWLLAFVPLLLSITGAGVQVSGPAGAAATQHDTATVARARAAFHKYMSSHRPMVHSSVTPFAAAATAGVPSLEADYNWSGYAVTESGSKTVSSVSGQWVIPYVECAGGSYENEDVITSQWIGIDGFSDSTVEQLGSSTQCFEGVTYYYVWYEMFPNGTIEEGPAACINNNYNCPQPGDALTAAVTVTVGGNYTLSLKDLSRPQENFSVTASCAPATCVDSSAEWIMERPAYDLPFGFQIVPLANFFRTAFFNGAVTSGGKATYIEGFQDGPVYDIAMIDDTASYFLDCVGSRAGPQVVLLSNTKACPVVAPSKGSFEIGWFSSF